MKNKPEISVAPMMDWTDRHCRYFHRLISPNAVLYTEMVTTGALIHGDSERFLRHDQSEHPVVLQLGGSDPADLARCAEMGAKAGYDAINLNCGCPSDRVQSGSFGACLMAEPAHVADCMEAMIAAVDIPVTIKCRIGIDDSDDLVFLDDFVAASVDKGVDTFIIHARKAWLKGLSPKQNRDIPPLDYNRVAAIKSKYPALTVILNGGITSVEQIIELSSPRRSIERLDSGDPEIVSIKDARLMDPVRASSAFAERQRDDGVSFDGFMIGREAYSNPYVLAEIERKIFGNHDITGHDKIARAMADYAQKQFEAHGTPVKSITRHILGLYHHQPGAKAWKRYLSDHAPKAGGDHTVILRALEAVETEKKRHQARVAI